MTRRRKPDGQYSPKEHSSSPASVSDVSNDPYAASEEPEEQTPSLPWRPSDATHSDGSDPFNLPIIQGTFSEARNSLDATESPERQSFSSVEFVDAGTYLRRLDSSATAGLNQVDDSAWLEGEESPSETESRHSDIFGTPFADFDFATTNSTSQVEMEERHGMEEETLERDGPQERRDSSQLEQSFASSRQASMSSSRSSDTIQYDFDRGVVAASSSAYIRRSNANSNNRPPPVFTDTSGARTSFVDTTQHSMNSSDDQWEANQEQLLHEMLIADEADREMLTDLRMHLDALVSRKHSNDNNDTHDEDVGSAGASILNNFDRQVAATGGMSKTTESFGDESLLPEENLVPTAQSNETGNNAYADAQELDAINEMEQSGISTQLALNDGDDAESLEEANSAWLHASYGSSVQIDDARERRYEAYEEKSVWPAEQTPRRPSRTSYASPESFHSARRFHCSSIDVLNKFEEDMSEGIGRETKLSVEELSSDHVSTPSKSRVRSEQDVRDDRVVGNHFRHRGRTASSPTGCGERKREKHRLNYFEADERSERSDDKPREENDAKEEAEDNEQVEKSTSENADERSQGRAYADIATSPVEAEHVEAGTSPVKGGECVESSTSPIDFGKQARVEYAEASTSPVGKDDDKDTLAARKSDDESSVSQGRMDTLDQSSESSAALRTLHNHVARRKSKGGRDTRNKTNLVDAGNSPDKGRASQSARKEQVETATSPVRIKPDERVVERVHSSTSPDKGLMERHQTETGTSPIKMASEEFYKHQADSNGMPEDSPRRNKQQESPRRTKQQESPMRSEHTESSRHTKQEESPRRTEHGESSHSLIGIRSRVHRQHQLEERGTGTDDTDVVDVSTSPMEDKGNYLRPQEARAEATQTSDVETPTVSVKDATTSTPRHRQSQTSFSSDDHVPTSREVQTDYQSQTDGASSPGPRSAVQSTPASSYTTTFVTLSTKSTGKAAKTQPLLSTISSSPQEVRINSTLQPASPSPTKTSDSNQMEVDASTPVYRKRGRKNVKRMTTADLLAHTPQRPSTSQEAQKDDVMTMPSNMARRCRRFVCAEGDTMTQQIVFSNAGSYTRRVCAALLPLSGGCHQFSLHPAVLDLEAHSSASFHVTFHASRLGAVAGVFQFRVVGMDSLSSPNELLFEASVRGRKKIERPMEVDEVGQTNQEAVEVSHTYLHFGQDQLYTKDDARHIRRGNIRVRNNLEKEVDIQVSNAHEHLSVRPTKSSVAPGEEVKVRVLPISKPFPAKRQQKWSGTFTLKVGEEEKRISVEMDERVFQHLPTLQEVARKRQVVDQQSNAFYYTKRRSRKGLYFHARAVEFGACQVGDSSTVPVYVCNGSSKPMTVFLRELQDPFRCNYRTTTILPQKFIRVPVVCTPKEEGKVSMQMSVYSTNDQASITLVANGVA